MSAIVSISGRGLPLRGDDLDTDRIMPARFLRAVTFEGLEKHVFEDDRAAMAGHPFDDPRYAGATVLVVNRNFGCGSSREHAPQGLARFGIRAMVGESFSEIFLGNASLLGLPCFAAAPADVDHLFLLLSTRATHHALDRFDRAVVSYNGDFVIHFRHPTWRDDQNDPATATRINERKVR